MSAPRVLLLGGHGKVSLHLTPLLLAKSWNVTSVIRDPKQQDEILALGKGQKGQVDVLVESLDDVKSDADARKVLDKVKPDYVIWSAGESSLWRSRSVLTGQKVLVVKEGLSAHTQLIRTRPNTTSPLRSQHPPCLSF
jgi:nucleoside-diphosphate-sugar epimerase